MSMPLAHYLKDFSSPKPSSVVSDAMGFDEDAFGLSDAPLLELPQPDPIDLEAERKQAFEEGRQAAIQELSEQYAQEKMNLEANHLEEVEALKQLNQIELARVMGDGLQRILEAVSRAVSEQTIAVIAPFLQEALIETALKDMSTLLKEAIVEGDIGTVTVRGPGPLFDRLRNRMEGYHDLLRHVEADDLDLTVDIHDTALVTRISAWTASLKKVLA